MTKDRVTVFTAEEVGHMAIIVATAKPDEWDLPEVKALIWKCKAAITTDESVSGDGRLWHTIGSYRIER